MPELPEVETVLRGLWPVLAGQVLARVTINRHDLRVPVPQEFAAQVAGRRVEAMERRAKYILCFLEDGGGFALHLGMSGRIHIYAPGQAYRPEKHDHAVFESADGHRVVFNDARRFGMLFPVARADWPDHEAFCRIGPEPLANGFNGPALRSALGGRQGPVKTALLDQRVVAGVGNIYACEALYRARIAPNRRACDVGAAEAERLAAAIRSVLAEAIESGGSTLRDYKRTDGSLGYFQHRFDVYGREGEPCGAARAQEGSGPAQNRASIKKHTIKRVVQAGRSTFYCPACQAR